MSQRLRMTVLGIVVPTKLAKCLVKLPRLCLVKIAKVRRTPIANATWIQFRLANSVTSGQVFRLLMPVPWFLRWRSFRLSCLCLSPISDKLRYGDPLYPYAQTYVTVHRHHRARSHPHQPSGGDYAYAVTHRFRSL